MPIHPVETGLTAEWPNLGEWRQIRPRPFVRQNLVKKSLRCSGRPQGQARNWALTRLMVTSDGKRSFCTHLALASEDFAAGSAVVAITRPGQPQPTLLGTVSPASLYRWWSDYCV